MKVLSRFSVFQDKAPPALFRELVEICPEGQAGKVFTCRLPKGDARLVKLLKVMAKHGLRPDPRPPGRRRAPNEYGFRLDRKYEVSDFESCRLLIPGCTDDGLIEEVVERAPVGAVLLSRDTVERGLAQNLQLGWAGISTMIVSYDLMNEMNAAGLKHVKFQPVFVGNQNCYLIIRDYWEVFSEYVLPTMKMSALRKLRYRDHPERPFDGDYNEVVLKSEGFFSSAETHYRASDLEQCETFDLARPKERIPDFNLIASKRFYDFCTARRLNVSWRPVRIDPD